MKHRALTTSLLFIAILTSAFAPPTKGINYSSVEGKMSITFPAAFESSIDTLEESKMVQITSTIGDRTLFASYTLHNLELTDPKGLAELSLSSFNENIKGSIVNKTEWNLKGKKGLIAMIDLEAQASKIQYQIIIIGNIQYQLVVVTPKTTWNQKSANSFFKSFKVRE